MKTEFENDLLYHISRLSPLNQVPPKHQSELCKLLKPRAFAKGSVIIRSSIENSDAFFLIEGSVEIRHSFDQRQQFTADIADQALHVYLPDEAAVKVRALEECRILAIDKEQLDSLLVVEKDYTIHYLDEGEVTLDNDTLIDDNFQEDWDNVFIRSNLAANLPHSVIHELMSQLENIEVKSGDTVVKANTAGDYFYIIKQGSAIVETAVDGPFNGEKFRLTAGSYFGDEALVAETTRNANVIMASDGVLGRLNIDAFNQLIKQSLVEPLPIPRAELTGDVKLIDVRFPIEFNNDKVEGAENIPISFLRQQLDQLQMTSQYVITPANDSRAELATYIMRQAGFHAYNGFAPQV